MPAPVHDADPIRFNWFAQWYPVLPLSYLEGDKPTKLKLLGLDIVLWPDQEGTWRAGRDQCPHRLAALSEGWLQDGKLQCRYHGWTYNGEGKCVACPQANARQEEHIVGSGRVSLQTYPTKEHAGLLWVWPSSNPEAWIESAANPPPTDEEFRDPSWAGAEAEWNVIEQPVSWHTLVENSMDPSHGTFLHEGVLGDKKNAAPITMAVDEQPSAQGFQVRHDGYTKQQKADSMRGTRRFTAPSYVKTLYHHESGKQVAAALYFVPIAAQTTRVMAKFTFKATDTPGQKGPGFAGALFSGATRLLDTLGLLHIAGSGIVDQDSFMLHSQEMGTAASEQRQRAYRLATPADTGVSTFWRWLSMVGGDIPFADGRSMFDLKPRTRAQLLDRWDRHVKLCPSCKKTLSRIDRTRQLLLLSAMLIFTWALVTLSLTMGSVVKQHQGPLLLLSGIMMASHALLGRLRGAFFSTSKPPGTQWHEAPPFPAVERIP